MRATCHSWTRMAQEVTAPSLTWSCSLPLRRDGDRPMRIFSGLACWRHLCCRHVGERPHANLPACAPHTSSLLQEVFPDLLCWTHGGVKPLDILGDSMLLVAGGLCMNPSFPELTSYMNLDRVWSSIFSPPMCSHESTWWKSFFQYDEWYYVKYWGLCRAQGTENMLLLLLLSLHW